MGPDDEFPRSRRSQEPTAGLKEEKMGSIVVTEFVSMDGVMQAPGGEGFKYENWTFDFDRGEDGGAFKAEEIFNAEAQLIGRITYESFAGAWPKYEKEWEGEAKEFAIRFNSMPKYVVSSTLADPEWTNCTVIDGSGDVPGEVVLGTGDRLFGEFSEKSTWKLAESNPVGSDGVLTLVYRRT